MTKIGFLLNGQDVVEVTMTPQALDDLLNRLGELSIKHEVNLD